jgi:hypothetical protein
MIADSWIEKIKGLLDLSSCQKEEVLHELSTHLEEKIEELEREGLSEDEAGARMAKVMGSSEKIAQEFNQVYARGSEKEAILASLPYFICFSLLSFGLEKNMGALILAGGSVILAMFLGRTTRSSWVLTWVGYSFVLLFALGFVMWNVISSLALVYSLAVVSLLLSKVIGVAKEDPYLIPLISVPPLIFGVWFLEGAPNLPLLTLLGFLVLAISCLIFIMGGRRVKLITSLAQIFILGLILSSEGTTGFWALPAILITGLVLREAWAEQH